MDNLKEMDTVLLVEEYAAAIGELAVRDYKGDPPYSIEVQEWAKREADVKEELKRRLNANRRQVNG